MNKMYKFCTKTLKVGENKIAWLLYCNIVWTFIRNAVAISPSYRLDITAQSALHQADNLAKLWWELLSVLELIAQILCAVVIAKTNAAFVNRQKSSRFRPRRLPRFRSQWQGGICGTPRSFGKLRMTWKERKDRLWRLIPPQCRLSNQYLPTSPSSVKSKTSATVMRLCMPGRLLPFRQEAILLRDMPVSLTRRYSDIFFSVRTFENCSQNGNAGWCGVYCASISSNAKGSQASNRKVRKRDCVFKFGKGSLSQPFVNCGRTEVQFLRESVGASLVFLHKVAKSFRKAVCQFIVNFRHNATISYIILQNSMPLFVPKGLFCPKGSYNVLINHRRNAMEQLLTKSENWYQWKSTKWKTLNISTKKWDICSI